MIWIISNEAEECGIFTTFEQYKKAFDEGEMDIYCARQDDDFSFIKADDVVIIRTRDKRIYENLMLAQSKTKFKSTLESMGTLELTYDKELLKSVLEKEHLQFPQTIAVLENEKSYFVKPKYGEDSIGVDEMSKCNGVEDVSKKFESLLSKGLTPIVEEYIDGMEVTTAIINNQEDNPQVYSAFVKPNNNFGFHTSETKRNYDFTPHRCSDENLKEICLKAFKAIGATHYIRIDSRICNGVPYIIDINMIAGLNRKGYMAKCLEVNGVDYFDFIRMVVKSAK